jgi:hypothetical protein
MTVRPCHRRGAALLLTAAAMAGCAEVEEAERDAYEPARLVPAAGGGAATVRLTAEGARRIHLRTAPVTRAGADVAVPYAALLYAGDGSTHVYASPAPLTFRRTAVTVDRIVGARALLRAGPRPGTRVVTVGATEVYGTETEIAGGH